MNRSDEWVAFAAGAFSALKPQTARGLCVPVNHSEVEAIAYAAAAIADTLMAELDAREKRGDFE